MNFRMPFFSLVYLLFSSSWRRWILRDATVEWRTSLADATVDETTFSWGGKRKEKEGRKGGQGARVWGREGGREDDRCPPQTLAADPAIDIPASSASSAGRQQRDAATEPPSPGEREPWKSSERSSRFRVQTETRRGPAETPADRHASLVTRLPHSHTSPIRSSTRPHQSGSEMSKIQASPPARTSRVRARGSMRRC